VMWEQWWLLLYVVPPGVLAVLVIVLGIRFRH
jgi:hypothetical protein